MPTFKKHRRKTWGTPGQATSPQSLGR